MPSQQPNRLRHLSVLIVALSIMHCFSAGASAQLSDFVIDPTQSYITASNGIYVNVEQFPGSLTTQLFGDLYVDQMTPGLLKISSVTSIGLQTQSTNSIPQFKPAQISGRVQDFPSQFKSVAFAMRGVTIGMTDYSTSVSGDNFNLFGSIFNFASGESDLIGSGLGGSKTPTVTTGVSTTGTIQPTPSGEQITIPFSFFGYIGLIPSNPQFFGRTTTFEGQIVANYTGPQILPSGVQATNLAVNSLVYSPQNHMLYGSTGASADHPNGTITQIDPKTGAIGTAYDSNSVPTTLVISSDGSQIHAVTNDSANVQRFNVAQGAFDLNFALGGQAPFTIKVGSIAAVPGQADEVLVTRTVPSLSPRLAGTAIYKDGVALPDNIGGSLGGPDFSRIDPTGQLIYGYTASITPNAYVLAEPTNTGLHQIGGSFGGYGDGKIAAGKLFRPQGDVIDLFTGQTLGAFLGSGDFTFDIEHNRLLSLTNTSAGWVVRAYDLTSLSLLGSETIPVVTGQTFDLQRWGDRGLAFRDANEVYTIQTSLVPEPSTLALAVLGAAAAVALRRKI